MSDSFPWDHLATPLGEFDRDFPSPVPCPGVICVPTTSLQGFMGIAVQHSPGELQKPVDLAQCRGNNVGRCPGTGDVLSQSYVFTGSSVPSQALTGTQHCWDVGALWVVSRCFCGSRGHLCPGSPLLPRSTLWSCTAPPIPPLCQAPLNNQVITLCHPFTGFNTNRSTERGFGQHAPTPSLQQQLLHFQRSAETLHTPQDGC